MTDVKQQSQVKVNILEEAKKLRAADPKKYGVHGTTKGQEGYIAGGWAQAVKDAGAKFGKPKPPKPEGGADVTKAPRKPRAKKSEQEKEDDIRELAKYLKSSNPSWPMKRCLEEARKDLSPASVVTP